MSLIALFLGFMIVAVSRSQNSTLMERDYERIIHGEPAPIDEVPYQIAIEQLNRHECGGSIISRDIVITCAHCLTSTPSSNAVINLLFASPAFVRVRAGNDYSSVGGTLYKVMDWIIHEKYDRNAYDYDIALIRVKTPFKYSNAVKPIDVARTGPKAGEMAVITGFGSTSPLRNATDRKVMTPLMKITVPIVDLEKCREIMSKFTRVQITDNMLCAGYLDERIDDACRGDSGGPMAVDGKIVGLTTWGLGCGRKGLPGIYMNVARFTEWIEKTKRELHRIL